MPTARGLADLLLRDSSKAGEKLERLAEELQYLRAENERLLKDVRIQNDEIVRCHDARDELLYVLEDALEHLPAATGVREEAENLLEKHGRGTA